MAGDLDQLSQALSAAVVVTSLLVVANLILTACTARWLLALDVRWSTRSKAQRRSWREFAQTCNMLGKAGTVTLESLSVAFDQYPKLRHELLRLGIDREELVDMFRRVDTDCTGTVTCEELVHGLVCRESLELLSLVKGLQSRATVAMDQRLSRVKADVVQKLDVQSRLLLDIRSHVIDPSLRELGLNSSIEDLGVTSPQFGMLNNTTSLHDDLIVDIDEQFGQPAPALAVPLAVPKLRAPGVSARAPSPQKIADVPAHPQLWTVNDVVLDQHAFSEQPFAEPVLPWATLASFQRLQEPQHVPRPPQHDSVGQVSLMNLHLRLGKDSPPPSLTPPTPDSADHVYPILSFDTISQRYEAGVLVGSV